MAMQVSLRQCLPSRHRREDDFDRPYERSSAHEHVDNRLHVDVLQVRKRNRSRRVEKRIVHDSAINGLRPATLITSVEIPTGRTRRRYDSDNNIFISSDYIAQNPVPKTMRHTAVSVASVENKI